jgi:hypothetical protein
MVRQHDRLNLLGAELVEREGPHRAGSAVNEARTPIL